MTRYHKCHEYEEERRRQLELLLELEIEKIRSSLGLTAKKRELKFISKQNESAMNTPTPTHLRF
jgi:hypothetical protein